MFQAKDQAWQDLAKVFAEQSTAGVTRTADQLKTCWHSIKKNARKNLATDKVFFFEYFI
jgi:hypothetical protein